MPVLISQEDKNKVHFPSQKPFEEVSYVAIAICRTRPNRYHAGILYKDQDNCHLLHVPGDMTIQRDPPETRYIWIAPSIHPARLPQIAAYCRLVWNENENNGIPYAFSDPRDSFDSITGKFLSSENKIGLTCASFVLAIFFSTGFQLVDFNSWQKRDDDEEAFTELANYIESKKDVYKLDDEFIKNMRNEIKNFRYRPEEVAGAGMAFKSDTKSIGFEEAIKYGEYISNIFP